MEEKDYQSLHHPQTYILSKGGHILVALLEGEAVGVCALLRSDREEFDFELAKMGVTPELQGRGIGKALGLAVLEKVRQLSGRKIFLESNTVLQPALELYRKLGFKKSNAQPSPYKRSNIQLELDLGDS